MAQGSYEGEWVGGVTQVDSGSPYVLLLTLSGTSGESYYPELACRGVVTEIARANGAVTYVESIVENRSGPGNPGGCIDGTFTVTGTGHQLGWSWIGRYEGTLYFAYAVLDRKPSISRPTPAPR